MRTFTFGFLDLPTHHVHEFPISYTCRSHICRAYPPTLKVDVLYGHSLPTGQRNDFEKERFIYTYDNKESMSSVKTNRNTCPCPSKKLTHMAIAPVIFKNNISIYASKIFKLFKQIQLCCFPI